MHLICCAVDMNREQESLQSDINAHYVANYFVNYEMRNRKIAVDVFKMQYYVIVTFVEI